MTDVNVYKAFEEATRKNITAAVDHGNETRRLQRETEQQVEQFKSMIMSMQQQIQALQQQVAILQARTLGGGPTHGSNS